MQKFFQVSFLILAVVLTGACSKKSSKPQARARFKVPVAPITKSPTGPKLDQGAQREFLFNIKLSSDLEQSLQNDNLYTPDNCVQLIRYRKAGQVVGDFLELSNDTCNYNGYQDMSNVVKVIPTEPGEYPTSRSIISETGVKLGELVIEGELANAPDDTWVLDTLCSGDFADQCLIIIEASKYKDVWY